MKEALITIAIGILVYVVKEWVSMFFSIRIENKKHLHQIEMDKKSLYINSYFDTYNKIYKLMRDCSREVLYFCNWEKNIHRMYSQLLDSDSLLNEKQKIEYQHPNCSSKKGIYNYCFFEQELLNNLIKLQEYYHQNKLVLNQDEKELLDEYLEIVKETHKIIEGFSGHLLSMRAEGREVEAVETYLPKIENDICVNQMELEDLNSKFEIIFKEKFM
ncbi:hypothetical protein ACSSAF_06610 [Staphylococcus succinus]|uniref:hypothetical protein n=1 Tax=Staphylococcus succinus TaxID=61015 RepID=UPI003F5B66C5